MKTQLRKLNRLIKIDCLNPDNYYAIEICEYDIKFQGKFNSDLAKNLTELFGEGKVHARNGFVGFSKYDINIVLS